jgi:hypothetical protein
MKFKAPKGVGALRVQGKLYKVDADGNITIGDELGLAIQEMLNEHGWRTQEQIAASDAASRRLGAEKAMQPILRQYLTNPSAGAIVRQR